MKNQTPKVSIDILILKENKVLLGLFTKKWLYKGKQVYGVPGWDIQFNEKIGDTVKRNIQEDIGCILKDYKIISVNANYAFDNHYIGIGVLAEIDGEPQITQPEDWEKWEWVDIHKLPDNLFPAAENLIRSYLENRITVSE